MIFSLRTLAAALLLCCAASPLHAQDPSIVTRDELAATGEATVHAALRVLRPGWLRFRGSTQSYAAVYVDSVPAADTLVLGALRPEQVQWVQYSTPAEARVRFEPQNRSGIIHVSTRLPLAAAHPAIPEPPAFQRSTGVTVSALAMRHAGGHVQLDDFSGAGGAVALSIPFRGGASALVAVQLGTGSASGSPDGVQLASAEAGAKFHFGRSRVAAPFVAGLLGAHKIMGGDGRAGPFGNPTTGLGGSGGAGVDVRVGSRVLLTSELRMSLVDFGGLAGRITSLRVGTTLLTGR